MLKRPLLFSSKHIYRSAISGDSSTYSHSTGLPYMKPCQYLCTNIPPICSYSVAVLLGDKVVPYNCNALDTSASYLEPLYDTSNNPDQCNALLNIYNQVRTYSSAAYGFSAFTRASFVRICACVCVSADRCFSTDGAVPRALVSGHFP